MGFMGKPKQSNLNYFTVDRKHFFFDNLDPNAVLSAFNEAEDYMNERRKVRVCHICVCLPLKYHVTLCDKVTLSPSEPDDAVSACGE
jgi:hypothetical protein